MAIKAKEPETAVAIAIAPPQAALVLTNREAFNSFYDEIRRETDALEYDLTTERGRKAIASMAYKVARTKTAIDDAGKLLTEEWREKISIIDASRRDIRAKLDALKDEVRAPLTEWEKAEEARLALANQIVTDLRNDAVIFGDDTAHDIANRLDAIKSLALDAAVLGGHFDIAVNLRKTAIEALTNAHARLIKEEDDRRELERLRAAEAERIAREEQERVEADRIRREAEAAEKAKAEAERQRLAEIERERLDQERQAEAIKAAEIAAAKAEAQRAEDARLAQEKAHEDALAAERKRADEAEAEAHRVAQQQWHAEQIREAEAKRLAAEQEAREKDRKHRGEVMGAAKNAIVAMGVGAETAKKIVVAIVAGEIPNVTLRF